MDLTGAVWRKSRRSANQGNSCVEVAAVWRKSRRSANQGNTCVEVARNLPGIVAVRDSKNPDGPKLGFTRGQWTAFLARVKGGAYDL